jgi:hypothetical protein
MESLLRVTVMDSVVVVMLLLFFLFLALLAATIALANARLSIAAAPPFLLRRFGILNFFEN